MEPFPLERIRHVAQLAELELTAEEEVRLAGEIGKIVAFVAELDALDTANVPPTATVIANASPLRPDEPREGLSHEDALAGAPRAAHGGFEVPTFVE
jgi:aspartyl-tRNA(Asn)/glutamyl-tRNA(Gln) amidotransferase subunit C